MEDSHGFKWQHEFIRRTYVTKCCSCTSYTIEQWLSEERAVRERMDRGAGPGVARPEQVAGKSGLEVMQAKHAKWLAKEAKAQAAAEASIKSAVEPTTKA